MQTFPSVKDVGTRLAETRRRHGMGAVADLLFDRTIYRTLNVDVVNLVWLDLADVRVPARRDSPFTFRFLNAGEVQAFAADPSNALGPEHVERVAGCRDFCFAALADGRLAAYGWYALESIEARHAFGVAMSYPKDVAYMYKGFTHPDYRGARLHASVMGLALRQLANHGVTKLVSMVDWTNAASMQSCYRLGYTLLGRMWVIRCGRREMVIPPRRAMHLGVRFGAAAAPRPTAQESIFSVLDGLRRRTSR